MINLSEINMAIQDLDIEQNLRICNAAQEYYSMAESPSQYEYDMWLESLDESMKADCKKLGKPMCEIKLNFKRFILELRDIGMDQFMMEKLSGADYDFWKKNHLYER